MPTVKTVWGLAVVSSLLVTFSARAADPAIPPLPVPPVPLMLADLCRQSGGEELERVCRSLEQFGRSSGQVCRAPGTPDEACTVLDGRHLSEQRIDDYEATWEHRALSLQRRLDENLPPRPGFVRLGFIPGTHNSFNSAAYAPTLSGLDHNQVYTLTDQLKMDMRSLELDVHWFPSASGDPADGRFAPILCHGEPVAVGPASVHVGCTLERHLRDGLQEIRDWLDANPDEFLLLYLENNLDGDPHAHDAAAEAIQEKLGDLVLQPTADCAPMPKRASRREILDGGHRVLIVGNCGPGDWGKWVHERDQQEGDQDQEFTWVESSSPPRSDYPDYPDCEGKRAENGYDTHFIRYYEDSTWLTVMVGGEPRELTVEDTRNMVRCGVNLTGFDQLEPKDPRLEAMIWSWAEGQPTTNQGCARHDKDGRLQAADCSSSQLPFACRDDGGKWLVSPSSGAWAAGATACPAEYSFAVPRTGYENELLKDGKTAASVEAVWVNYAASGGEWVPGP